MKLKKKKLYQEMNQDLMNNRGYSKQVWSIKSKGKKGNQHKENPHEEHIGLYDKITHDNIIAK
jgi:hypothetical protein